MTLSRAAFLRVVVPATGRDLGDGGVPNAPLWRHTSLNIRFLPEELRSALASARSALEASEPIEAPPITTVTDPARRLEAELDDLLGIEPFPGTSGVAALVVVGDLYADEVLSAAADAFGDVAPGAAEPATIEIAERLRVVDLGVDVAQARIGYVVPAPPPTSPDLWAWRALLYIVSHGYEGRLGTEAISRRGLVYYIDGHYLTDGINGRVSLSIGVDPDKLGAVRALIEETLADLRRHPPTEAELDEARSHFLGRRISAAQSNEEVSARLAEEWVTLGRLPTDEDFRARLSGLDLEDLERVIPAFTSGAVVVVRPGR
jgi:predicted Zn-dependent peptidase